jgi:peptidoglycan lytic transglycosylase
MQTDQRAGGSIPRPFPFVSARGVFAASVLAAVLVVTPCVPARGDSLDDITIGKASWYGQEFAQRPTASGEPFDPNGLTAAHRTLPLGSRLRVTNLHNGKTVEVTITDRGPFCAHRDIDLSYGAARALGMLRRGIARVAIELLES